MVCQALLQKKVATYTHKGRPGCKKFALIRTFSTFLLTAKSNFVIIMDENTYLTTDFYVKGHVLIKFGEQAAFFTAAYGLCFKMVG